MARNNIPFVKYGGFKFLESLHIKDVLAHLKVINNPKDRLSWLRVLKIIPGIGAKTAMKIGAAISEQGLPQEASELISKGRRTTSELQQVIELINELREQHGPISEKVDRINRYYYPFLKENYDNYPKRIRDLEQLADLTVAYKSLNRFLNDMALEPPDEERKVTSGKADALVLSTIHSAKGLEWHTVMLIWAVEGRMPSPMALDSPDEMEEERRLLYSGRDESQVQLVIVAPVCRWIAQEEWFRCGSRGFLKSCPRNISGTYVGQT